MSRYIDVENLSLTKFHPRQIEINPTEEGVISYQLGWNDAIDSIIEFEPTADVVEHKRGEWLYKPMKGQFCSVCDMQSVWKYNYCPNCGAEMEHD